MLGFSSLAQIPFASIVQKSQANSLNVTLDNISISCTGNITKNGVLSLTLDDVNFSANGTATHNNTLSLILSDIGFSASGFVTPQSLQLTKGGLPKKKIKKEREEVEKAVTKAVNKSLGIVEPEDIVEQVEETKQPEIDYTAQINDMVLRMQAEALGLSIEQYLIESELDDEEAILLFL